MNPPRIDPPSFVDDELDMFHHAGLAGVQVALEQEHFITRILAKKVVNLGPQFSFLNPDMWHRLDVRRFITA